MNRRQVFQSDEPVYARTKVRLTLTFDNGPWAGWTDEIVSILKERGLPATFFVVGNRLIDSAARAAAERARAEGHWIANHTLTHRMPLGTSPDPDHAEREIGDAERLLEGLAYPGRLFRPPGRGVVGPHLLSRSAVDYLVAHRYTVVTWNNYPRELEEPRTQWTARAFETMQAQPWSLLVVHDHHLAPMMDTLRWFLDTALDKGVEFSREFPDECVPIRDGTIVGPLDAVATIP
jgi:peptidoglycan/xylan/chitin deacetylase (PgdA/CDA1 family)